MHRRIPEHSVHGPKEGGLPPPCGQFETPEQVPSEEKVQDGGHLHVERSHEERRLAFISGSQGCLPLTAHSCVPQTSALQVGWEVLRVPMPTLRFSQCPEGIY